jgi:hypothetical protein
VPVTPLGTGVTVGDAPNCRPFGPTGAPGAAPSEEVMPSEGMVVPTWANAGLQPSNDPTAAMINNGRIKDSPIMVVDKGWIASGVAPRSTCR